MARQIKVTEIDDFFRDLVVDLVKSTTLEWTTRVKKATPVDTGRLIGRPYAFRNSGDLAWN